MSINGRGSGFRAPTFVKTSVGKAEHGEKSSEEEAQSAGLRVT